MIVTMVHKKCSGALVSLKVQVLVSAFLCQHTSKLFAVMIYWNIMKNCFYIDSGVATSISYSAKAVLQVWSRKAIEFHPPTHLAKVST